MSLSIGSLVTISHYSMTSVFTSTVLAVNENSIEVKLPRECMRADFSAGDPLAVAYEFKNSPIIKGGRVIYFNARDGVLVFEEDLYEEEMRMRSYDRFPVSLYADYRVVEEMVNRKNYALVKDISEHGLLIYSRESHFNGLNLSMDIYITRSVLTMDAEIVRRVEHDGYYEYGLRIKHQGSYVLNQIKNYIKKSESELIANYKDE
ncbi:MAG: PilZ domain-containing protein [Clostridiaceae bacterium]|nr:PilZ domain-containing protein [Clostridiaceae bacterium]